jgi:hypothetical protein
MATKSRTIEEIKKTNKNTSEETDIYDAVVIANYGDPGLEEEEHADVLSRFVVCLIDSPLRPLTFEKYRNNLLVVVRRPEHLWIEYDGDFLKGNPSEQKRRDAFFNINYGKPGAYKTENIGKINIPYSLGEKIRIKKQTQSTTSLFSKTLSLDFPSSYKSDWHTKGLANLPNYNIPRLSNTPEIYLATKPISAGTSNTYNGYTGGLYEIIINKFQYEAAMIYLFGSEAFKQFCLENFSTANAHRLAGVHGGYIFSSYYRTKWEKLNALASASAYPYPYLPFGISQEAILYEDINIGNKVRGSFSSCLPLVVATPDSFTTPKVREGGVISYNPIYV